MDNEIEPAVGNWYLHLINDQVFQVIAVDEEEALVEIQHSDGDIEELTLDEWQTLDLVATDAPDDWTGPLDDVERDNLDVSSTRSEGERRGQAESRRSESLQTSDTDFLDEPIVERQPTDEAAASEATSGTVREARDQVRRSYRDGE